jgi:hypothetical protein
MERPGDSSHPEKALDNYVVISRRDLESFLAQLSVQALDGFTQSRSKGRLAKLGA